MTSKPSFKDPTPIAVPVVGGPHDGEVVGWMGDTVEFAQCEDEDVLGLSLDDPRYKPMGKVYTYTLAKRHRDGALIYWWKP